MPLRPVTLPFDGGIVVERIGTLAIKTQPDDEFGVLLDIGGHLNRTTVDKEHRYIMAPGQAAELVAELMKAGLTVDPKFMDQVKAFVEKG